MNFKSFREEIHICYIFCKIRNFFIDEDFSTELVDEAERTNTIKRAGAVTQISGNTASQTESIYGCLCWDTSQLNKQTKYLYCALKEGGNYQ